MFCSLVFSSASLSLPTDRPTDRPIPGFPPLPTSSSFCSEPADPVRIWTFSLEPLIVAGDFADRRGGVGRADCTVPSPLPRRFRYRDRDFVVPRSRPGSTTKRARRARSSFTAGVSQTTTRLRPRRHATRRARSSVSPLEGPMPRLLRPRATRSATSPPRSAGAAAQSRRSTTTPRPRVVSRSSTGDAMATTTSLRQSRAARWVLFTC